MEDFFSALPLFFPNETRATATQEMKFVFCMKARRMSLGVLSQKKILFACRRSSGPAEKNLCSGAEKSVMRSMKFLFMLVQKFLVE
jgi:hypothetical protein